MLNPSDADSDRNDPTLLRNIHFAWAWGFADLEVINPFALRSPDPKSLLRVADPIGPDNDRVIDEALQRTSAVLLASGNPPAVSLIDRMLQVQRHIVAVAAARGIPVYCLGFTQQGYPKHPLARGVHRVPDEQQPILYQPRKHQ
jgi:hypothetical protein